MIEILTFELCDLPQTPSRGFQQWLIRVNLIETRGFDNISDKFCDHAKVMEGLLNMLRGEVFSKN